MGHPTTSLPPAAPAPRSAEMLPCITVQAAAEPDIDRPQTAFGGCDSTSGDREKWLSSGVSSCRSTNRRARNHPPHRHRKYRACVSIDEA